MTAPSPPPDACPCGSGKPLATCCGPYLAGAAAASAQALMRSRYVAYTLGREAYLLATWHASTRPAALGLAGQPQARWLGLDIRRDDSQGPEHALVEFVARYKIGGRAYRLHEVSRFVREGGRWYYVAGDLVDPQAGRPDAPGTRPS